MLGACVWLVAGCAQPPSVAPVHAGWQAAVARHLDPAQAAPATTAALARGPETTLRPPITGPAHALAGIASYYWQEQTTASGEPFDRAALTAAHRTLPMHSRARVTNLANGRSVVVRINDRGPFKPGRVIDLSEAAARAINMTAQGLAPVRIEVVPDPGHSQ
jgi:rare lipoprotein A